MTRLARLEIAHVPAHLSIYAALFTNLQNAAELLGELRKQNKELEYTFLDARKILSITHLQAAIFRAINDMCNGRTKSHNIHSEVVLALNMNNNIGESFRKFGMTEQTKDLIVLKITESPTQEVFVPLEKAIQGDGLDFDEKTIEKLSDITEIAHLYKLKTNAGKDGIAAEARSEPSSERDILESAILGLIALRGAT